MGYTIPLVNFLLATFHFRNNHTWSGGIAIVKLGENRIAKIECHYSNTVGRYDCFDVKIIDICGGKIDQQRFHINDYLNAKDRSQRSDDRFDKEKEFHIWVGSYGQNQADWYIARPKSVLPLTNAIDNYLDLFKVECAV